VPHTILYTHHQSTTTTTSYYFSPSSFISPHLSPSPLSPISHLSSPISTIKRCTHRFIPLSSLLYTPLLYTCIRLSKVRRCDIHHQLLTHLSPTDPTVHHLLHFNSLHNSGTHQLSLSLSLCLLFSFGSFHLFHPYLMYHNTANNRLSSLTLSCVWLVVMNRIPKLLFVN
jgi:hypothetical protein